MEPYMTPELFKEYKQRNLLVKLVYCFTTPSALISNYREITSEDGLVYMAGVYDIEKGLLLNKLIEGEWEHVQHSDEWGDFQREGPKTKLKFGSFDRAFNYHMLERNIVVDFDALRMEYPNILPDIFAQQEGTVGHF